MSISGANKLTKRITSSQGKSHKSNGSSSEGREQKEMWAKCDIPKLLALGILMDSKPIIVLAEIFRLHWELWKTEKAKPFELPNKELLELKVDKHAKKRALDLLKTVGLIKVEFRPGQFPLVQVVAEYPNNIWKPF